MVLGSGSWPAEALSRCPSRHARLKVRKKAADHWWARGVKLYKRGHYNEAIEAWQCSNKHMPTADALFNIAKAAERARRWRLAVDSYSGFLRQRPNSPLAHEARRALQRLADKVRPRRALVRPTQRRVVARPRHSPGSGSRAWQRSRKKRTVGWATLGVGVALGVVAGALGGMAGYAKSTVESSDPGTSWAGRVSSLHKSYTGLVVGASIAACVGIASVITSVLLLRATGKHGEVERAHIIYIIPHLTPTGTGAGASVGWSF